MRIILICFIFFSKIAFSKVLLRPFASQGESQIEIDPHKEGVESLRFKPNTTRFKGITFGVDGVSLTYGNHIEPSEAEIVSKGKTDFIDFQGRVIKKSYGIDFYFQTFEGMYLVSDTENLNTESLEDGSSVRVYPKYPNMKLKQLGVNLFYIQKPGSYNYSAAFDQFDQQTSSGGSLVYMFSYNASDLESNEPFIPENQRRHFEYDGEISRMLLTSVGFLVGWGHTFVLNDFFISGIIMLGPALMIKKLFGASDESVEYGNGFRYNYRISGGYNGKNFFFGLANYIDETITKGSEMDIIPSVSMSEIFIGARF